MEPDREHFVTCTDCRKFHKEMIAEDRSDLIEGFRTIVKEEWQTSLNTVERVTRIENTQKWLIISVGSAWLAIFYLIIKEIFQ